MAEAETQKLWGIKIWDDTGIYYYTEIDVSTDVQHNRPTSSQLSLYNKRPFHIHNGEGFYFSGSCSGNFSDNKSGECYEDYNFDYRVDENGNYIYNTKYQLGFIHWMHNDHIKYLQLSEDLVIPVGILEQIDWSTEHSVDDGYACKISFNWEQLDDEYALDGYNGVSYCPSCGAMLATSAVYCSKCGTKVGDT